METEKLLPSLRVSFTFLLVHTLLLTYAQTHTHPSANLIIETKNSVITGKRTENHRKKKNVHDPYCK